MSGKDKAENFDDDFELDALDEASWSDDGSELSESSSEEGGDSATKGVGAAGKPPREKKSGGGMLTGIVVLALLGGGSFYAYQSGLIPGVGPGSAPAAGESVMPALTEADDTSAAAPESLQAETAVMDEAQDMPPMPESSDIISDTGTIEGDAPITAAAPPASDDALTPMPEGEGALELAPLDSSEGEIQIAQVAEKDGMLADPTSTETPETAGSAGKLEDGVMAVPGSDALAEDSIPLVGDSDPSDAVPLDESALMGETEKAPTDSAASDGLAEISDELAGTPPVETSALPNVEDDLNAAGESVVSDLKQAGEVVGSVDSASAPAEPKAPEAPAPAPADSAVEPMPETKTEATSTAPAKSEADKAPAPADSPAPAVSATTTESKPAAAAEPVIEKAPDSVKPAEVAKPAKPVIVPNWVLKSAKPGSAVLYDKRTGDVKNVEVGDRVSGLGTIKSVSKVDGKWVVQGTAGRVRQ